jgi:hypothetical protein
MTKYIFRYFIFEKGVKGTILKSTIIRTIITSQHNNCTYVSTFVQFTIAVTVTETPAVTRTVRTLTENVLTKKGCSWASSAVVGVWFTLSL